MPSSVPIKAAVVTVSDTRKPDNDLSGERLRELLEEFGAEVVDKLIVSDEPAEITAALGELSSRPGVNLILTTGGTGFAPRDNTPEATRAVIEREAPGIAEAMRRETAAKTPLSMLSRGIAGIAGEALIVNFPGAPRAVGECFEVLAPVLRHAVQLIHGDTAHEAKWRDGG
jgi:molybdenum cofactor synthesis domain-containing protein